MNYGHPMNYGGQRGYGGCEPSTLPRPTGFCRRWAKNIPLTHPRINPQTGVRRKVMCPRMDYGPDVDKEVEDDFWQAEEDCKEEMFSNLQPSPMPWGYRQGGSPQGQWSDPATMLENLIKEESRDIDDSMKYMRHATDYGYSPQKTFRDLATAHKMRAMAEVATMGAENLDPDLAAAMMASEEQGQALKHIPPAALFNRLFPEDNRKCTVLVRGASKYHRDYVKPERGAMLQDSLMSDVDAGIVSYGDLIFRRGEEKIPESLDIDHPPCPDGICEPKHKTIKIRNFKPVHVDHEGVELSWAKPKQDVKGYVVYEALGKHDKKPKEWKLKRVHGPPLIKKWDSMDPQREALVFHFAVIPIVEADKIPQVPPKDAAKVDVRRPKEKKGEGKIEIKDIEQEKDGISIEWEPVRAKGVRYLLSYSTSPDFVGGGKDIGDEVKVGEETTALLRLNDTQGQLVLRGKPVPKGKNIIYIKVTAVTDHGEHGHSDTITWDLINHTYGSVTKSHPDHYESEDSNDDDAGRHYYTVSSMPPLTGNFIQLRGSQPPPWFPGYFTVQPGVPKVMPLDEPNEALDKAWASMGPSQVDSPHGSFLLGKP